MPGLLAVVEIGSDPATLLLIVGVFFAVFILVAGAAYWLVARSRPGPQGSTTWQIDISRPLPVSKTTFDRLANATHTALSPPKIAPETRASLQRLSGARGAFVRFYRVSMIAIGVLGIGLSIVLFRQADSADMIGLPAAIILLLSLGALGNGLIPGPSIVPIEPIDPQLLEKVQVRVSSEPLTVKVGDREMREATDMVRRGASLDDAARVVHSGYDGLSEFEKSALRHVLEQALSTGQRPTP